jgi:NTP pyrophosphatase (non-canonical NTP hydrolase)
MKITLIQDVQKRINPHTDQVESKLSVVVDDAGLSALKEALARAANLWPDAPWQFKEFVDIFQYGKPMQDYKQLYERSTMTPAPIVPPAPASVATPKAQNPVEWRHADLVQTLKKDPSEIALEMTDHNSIGGLRTKFDLMHMALGIAGEAGELVDAIKKYTIYNKPLDVANVIEELGDLEWYMEGMRQRLRITREQVLEANISKLEKRYAAKKYSNEAAIGRIDKVVVGGTGEAGVSGNFQSPVTDPAPGSVQR